MQFEHIIKSGFTVIGIEGSTQAGDGFIQKLWEHANGRFSEIAHMAKRRSNGSLAGIWGAMSDFSRSFQPWQNDFTEGLYLAGAECEAESVPPEGWTRWDVPGYEYIRVKADAPDVFQRTLQHFRENGTTLAGAVHDYTDPATGDSYMMFPISRLEEP